MVSVRYVLAPTEQLCGDPHCSSDRVRTFTRLRLLTDSVSRLELPAPVRLTSVRYVHIIVWRPLSQIDCQSPNFLFTGEWRRRCEAGPHMNSADRLITPPITIISHAKGRVFALPGRPRPAVVALGPVIWLAGRPCLPGDPQDGPCPCLSLQNATSLTPPWL